MFRDMWFCLPLCLGICGSTFPGHYEEAFTGFRIAQGLGGAITFAYAPLFCMAVKTYINVGAAVVVLFGYVGAEFIIRKERKNVNSVSYDREVV